MYLAICDDDIVLCHTLRDNLLAFAIEENSIQVDVYHSGEELIAGCKLCNYDAVFLDLYMKEMTGFETAQALTSKHIRTNLIFFTSNSALVYDSFEYQPFYFLRKENYLEVLPRVMEKLKAVMLQNGVFTLDSRNDNEQISIENICYVMSDKHNIIINTTKYSYEVRKSMTETEKQLLQYDFIRIHKKYLVNLKYVKKVSMQEEIVYLFNNIALDMSRRSKNKVLESFKKYQRRMKRI